MTEKLIALVDGSIYSESVCNHAGWIAARTHMDVELYHVLGRRQGGGQSDLSGSIRLGARTRLLEELSTLDEQRAKLAQAQGRAILEDAKAIVEGHGVTNVVTRLRNDDLLEAFAEIEKDAALTVIGKRGEAADFAKLHLGSNMERIVRAGKHPVLVANRAFKPVKTVLIAFDGGVSSLKAVDFVARNRLFEGLDCMIVTIGSPTDATRKAIDDAVATLKAGGHNVETRIEDGQPEKVLGPFVEAEGIDLLVMGAYGHSRIRSLIIGSTTSEMIRTCKIPVLLMK